MPRPILDPYRFPPFMGKIRFRRIRNEAQGVLYQNVEPQIGLPLWIRYNIPGQYWEYSIDADLGVFYRLKENPYIPSDAYFLNRGVERPTVPSLGDVRLYVRNVSGVPKLCVIWDDGSEDIIAVGPVTGFPIGGVAFWKLDEATGAARADSIGSNTLTDNNSVVQSPGKVGSFCASFNGTTQRLSRTDTADVSMGIGVSFEFVGWVKFAGGGVVHGILGKDNVNPNRAYNLVYRNTTNRIEWTVYNSAGTGFTVTANNFGAPTVGPWYFFDVYFDYSLGEIGVSINRGSFDTLNGVDYVRDTADDFEIGRSGQGGSFLNGSADAIGLWKRILTSVERDSLYNSGNGLEP